MIRLGLLLTLTMLVSAGTVLAQAEDASSLPPEQEREARRAISTIKASASQLKHQLTAVENLIALGPAGADRLESTILEELAKLSEAAASISGPTQVDGLIEEQRQILKELRERENLTKEMIVQTGDPALEKLRQLTALQQREQGTRKQSQQRLLLRVDRWGGLLEAVEVQVHEQPEKYAALDLREAQTQLAAIRMKFEPADEVFDREQVLAQNLLMARQFDPKEFEGMQMLNEMRMALGLEPLLIDPKLVAAARMHSSDMQQNDFFSHESPLEGKKTFMDRAKIHDTSASGENIFLGALSAQDAIMGWFHSPGHHKIMLGDFDRQGLGKSGAYWTHMFGR